MQEAILSFLIFSLSSGSTIQKPSPRTHQIRPGKILGIETNIIKEEVEDHAPEHLFLAAFKRLPLNAQRALIRYDHAVYPPEGAPLPPINLFSERFLFQRAYPSLLFEYEQHQYPMHHAIQLFLEQKRKEGTLQLYLQLEKPYKRPINKSPVKTSP